MEEEVGKVIFQMKHNKAATVGFRGGRRGSRCRRCGKLAASAGGTGMPPSFLSSYPSGFLLILLLARRHVLYLGIDLGAE
jgi:hypothetical protein